MQLSVITTIDKRISLIEILSFSHSFLITGNKQSSEGPKKTVDQSFLLNMLSFYSWADNFWKSFSSLVRALADDP